MATQPISSLAGPNDALTLGLVEATDRLDRGFLSLALLYAAATAVLGILVAPFNSYDHDHARSLIIGIVLLAIVAWSWQRRGQLRCLIEDQPRWLLVGVLLCVGMLWADTGWRSSYYLLSYAVIPIAAVLASRRWSLLCAVLVATGYLAGLVIHGYTWTELGTLRDQDSIVANAIGYPASALFFSTAVNRLVGFVARINQIVAEQPPAQTPAATEAARAPERQRTKSLTPREVQIAQLVALGLTDEQIAKRLVVSLRTVNTHVANARRKTGTSNRTELGVLSVREGLVPLDSATAPALA